jgi:hypothetical protein
MQAEDVERRKLSEGSLAEEEDAELAACWNMVRNPAEASLFCSEGAVNEERKAKVAAEGTQADDEEAEKGGADLFGAQKSQELTIESMRSFFFAVKSILPIKNDAPGERNQVRTSSTRICFLELLKSDFWTLNEFSGKQKFVFC